MYKVYKVYEVLLAAPPPKPPIQLRLALSVFCGTDLIGQPASQAAIFFDGQWLHLGCRGVAMSRTTWSANERSTRPETNSNSNKRRLYGWGNGPCCVCTPLAPCIHQLILPSVKFVSCVLVDLCCCCCLCRCCCCYRWIIFGFSGYRISSILTA